MDNVDVIEIERVKLFEQRCKAYQEARKALAAKFHHALETVGQTWKDADYRKVCQLSAAVEQQLQAAGRVVDEHLVPFVTKKRSLMDDKRYSSPAAKPR